MKWEREEEEEMYHESSMYRMWLYVMDRVGEVLRTCAEDLFRAHGGSARYGYRLKQERLA